MPLTTHNIKLEAPKKPASVWRSSQSQHHAVCSPQAPRQDGSNDSLSRAPSSRLLSSSPHRFYPPSSLAKSASVSVGASTLTLKPTNPRVSNNVIHRSLLIAQILLSLVILILAVLFAYCTALPYSNTGFSGPADTASVNMQVTAPATTITATLVSTRQTETPLPHASHQYREESPNASAIDDPDIEPNPRGPADNQAVNSTVALTFYTATLPLTTLIYASITSLFTLRRPHPATFPAHQSLALLHKTTARRQITLRILLAASTLLSLGWIANNSIWTFCELSAPPSSSFAGAAAAAAASGSSWSRTRTAVCPAQVVRHHMRGVSGVSIGKIALGWVLVGFYVGYSMFLVGRCRRSRT